jgi:inner membrane transporter RhtA
MTTAIRTARPDAASAIVPYAALLGSMVSVIVGTSYAKHLFAEVGPEGTALYRAGFSAVLLLAVWRPWRRAWTRRELIDLALYGGSLGAMNLVFYKALATIPLGVAIAIEFIGPLGLSLFHSRRLAHFAWIGLAVVGLGLLLPIAGSVHALDGAHSLDLRGVGLALLAGLFWALYIVFGQRGSHVHPGHAVAVGMAVAALVIAPAGIAAAGLHLLTPRLMAQGLVVAVVSSALPFSLERLALKGISGRAFGVLVAGEPALGALFGLILLGEMLSARQEIAIACIIAAGAGSVLWSGDRSHGLPEDPVS